ncbi:hypothetical protein FISHEDRAFT_60474 [Fistulina hepatica ATCC 64428]|uniref:Reverse transcriptase domain-containing protein n=1 Tax=Fistulina hepatica ATCC 64428 TaxID=1128425 RepID=A0A0D7A7C5_9AGAR|nr:hypothetical protein FISHEDRAFT_60474 [Fistulina hepatica ATCC 64428]
MFADDTTVYLSEKDDYNSLQHILAEWCAASRAKFNIEKTVIIPIGSPEYRTDVLTRRKINANQIIAIDNEIEILDDGETTRILGGRIGNGANEDALWTPILEKIDRALAQWNRANPTMDGIRTFLWNHDGVTRVSMKTLQMHKLSGGKGVLDIVVRNEAIDLMWAKAYLNLGNTRVTWAYVADELINRHTNKSVEHSARQNVFLQTWAIPTAKGMDLPEDL